MGLFTRRKSRATRRAEARAIKAKAKLEAKLGARNEKRRINADDRRQTAAMKSGLKAQRNSDKAALKAEPMSARPSSWRVRVCPMPPPTGMKKFR